MREDGGGFLDRADAGRRLAQALEAYRGAEPLVLALPRGGVPVAYEVAKALKAPLGLLMVRKIGAPFQPELALGAVVDGHQPVVVWNDEVVRALAPSEAYLERAVADELSEIERRRHVYLGPRKPPDPAGRTVIVVDDGIATGATVRAALEALRRAGAARRILAVPVASADAIEMLSAEADEVVCLATPDPFFAVGAHYRDFSQVGDEEVIEVMSKLATGTRSEA